MVWYQSLYLDGVLTVLPVLVWTGPYLFMYGGGVLVLGILISSPVVVSSGLVVLCGVSGSGMLKRTFLVTGAGIACR